MKFMLVDRIEQLEPGKEITVSKNLRLAEEYLADHFPSFPVLPGVLILQVAIEAASWLVRLTSDFTHSMLVLKETRQVRYGSFVSPGESLRVKVKAKGIAVKRELHELSTCWHLEILDPDGYTIILHRRKDGTSGRD